MRKQVTRWSGPSPARCVRSVQRSAKPTCGSVSTAGACSFRIAAQDCLAEDGRACTATNARRANWSELDLTVTLTDDQLEAIAHRVAELLADRRASEPAPELLTVSQAAELAGVTRKTIANWLSAGRLRRHGVARRPWVSRVELEALLAPQRPQAEPSSRRGKPSAPTGQFARILIGD
jgi:excisionase family DNA binding protein